MRVSKSSVALVLVVATALVLACAPESDSLESGASPSAPPSASSESADPIVPRPRRPAVVREGAAVSRSPDGESLYVAHEDLGLVHRVDLPLADGAPLSVAMPGPPAAVLALDGMVLVTIRDAGPDPSGAPTGLLLAMRPDATHGLVEAGRALLPADAWGIAITPDERIALVTSAWTHQVSAVELATMKTLWSVDVAREPRGVVVRPEGKSAYVTHLTRATLTRIDAIDSPEPAVQEVKFPAAPTRTLPQNAEAATLSYAAALSPSGDRLYVARQALGAKGLEQWNGYATLDTLLTADETSLARAPTRSSPMWTKEYQTVFGEFGMMEMKDPTVTGPGPTQLKSAFAQPRALLYRATTDTLLVASEGEDTLVELDALSIDPAESPLLTYDIGSYDQKTMQTSCGAPSGIALSPDETMAYVFCRSTHNLARVDLDTLERVGGPRPRANVRYLSLAREPLDDKAALGRRMFFNGKDGVASGGFGCAGCHPDGRDDGHVWHVDESAGKDERNGIREGMMHSVEVMQWREPVTGVPRQTPMLAGRLSAAGPYGWKAGSSNLKHRILIGFSIHRWNGGWGESGSEGIKRAEALAAFVPKLPTPPVDRSPLTAVEERGRKVFLDPSVGCATCHVPDTEYTNRGVYELGPTPMSKARFSEEIDWKFKTPSLAFIGGTPPYLHDGGPPTLEALIELNGDRMGHTRQLARSDRDALVAFLKRL